MSPDMIERIRKHLAATNLESFRLEIHRDYVSAGFTIDPTLDCCHHVITGEHEGDDVLEVVDLALTERGA